MHTCRHARRAPVRNAGYWENKRTRNVARNKRNLRELKRLRWQALTLWECELRDADKLTRRLYAFLAKPNPECA